MSEGELVMLFSTGCQGNARIQADPSENTGPESLRTVLEIMESFLPFPDIALPPSLPLARASKKLTLMTTMQTS
jgi:hypothetical protein